MPACCPGAPHAVDTIEPLPRCKVCDFGIQAAGAAKSDATAAPAMAIQSEERQRNTVGQIKRAAFTSRAAESVAPQGSKAKWAIKTGMGKTTWSPCGVCDLPKTRAGVRMTSDDMRTFKSQLSDWKKRKLVGSANGNRKG